MFENKNKILTLILTGEHQHQAKSFFTVQILYYIIILGWEEEYLYGEKTFWFGADVPHPERRSKLENKWESTNKPQPMAA